MQCAAEEGREGGMGEGREGGRGGGGAREGREGEGHEGDGSANGERKEGRGEGGRLGPRRRSEAGTDGHDGAARDGKGIRWKGAAASQ